MKKARSAAIAGADEPTSAASLVGIGASAGGLEPLTALLGALPADTGSAFIVVQHLDPRHASNLAEILARSAPMPVSQVKDGMRADPNRIYIVPPNFLMSLEGYVLRLEPREEVRGLHMPIDHFFRSLARNHASRAMGVILSGTGSDGALGMREIKENGGITFAQDEKSARFAGMPHSAAATGAVDFVLTVEDIAREIVRLVRHPYVTAPLPPVGEEGSPPPAPPGQVGRIFSLLRTATGVDFSSYKSTTILRRITRRMTLRKMDALESYAAELERNPEELKALYGDLLIKVTNFFRDPGTFDALRRVVIPAILKERQPGDGRPIRVWVPGCATGEEAYSIAICFLEVLGERATEAPLRIFATDIDEAALQRARKGTYIENITADVSPERLRSFFTMTERRYQINKAVREMCTFARHDVGRDPPFSNLDLVSCRNLLIYFDAPLQKRVLSAFHYALKPGGFLTLGVSETTGASSDLFEVVDKRQKIYVRAPGSPRAVLPAVMPRPTGLDENTPAGCDETRVQERDVYREADRALLNHFIPAGVLVNDQMDILQFRGDTGHFLLPPPGKASLNLLKMAREGLLAEIKTAVGQAKSSGSMARREGVRVRRDGMLLELVLKVIPVKVSGSPLHFVVLFEEVPGVGTDKRKRGHSPGPGSRQDGGLRRGLEATKEHLQSTIEGQDAALEELRAANEEVLSSNEELQSANEELETAKEELQSTNEELTTANEEIQRQNAELSRSNNDLNNLFASASLPVLLVDKEQRIRRFTRPLQKILRIIPSDVGRPLRDFQFNLNLPSLGPLLAEVIETGVSKEREVQDLQGHWYSVRIQPYKTDAGRVEGAVLHFIDIDSPAGTGFTIRFPSHPAGDGTKKDGSS
jgi:two-component system, chemotaxis family, CheB/CheR fusion protein